MASNFHENSRSQKTLSEMRTYQTKVDNMTPQSKVG